MHQDRSRRFVRRQLMLAALLLLACLSVLVTVVLARYRTDEVNYLDFAAKVPESISLQAGSGWIVSNNVGTLSFYIDNTDENVEYAAKDQNVSIRLLASLSLSGISANNVQLSVTNGTSTTTYTATAVEITEGTTLYKTFGAGQVYKFMDGEGKEMSWLLTGGGYSVLSAQLKVVGVEKIENAALLQLQVIGN